MPASLEEKKTYPLSNQFQGNSPRVALIINPISGGKKKKKIVATLAKHLEDRHFAVKIFWTERPKHAIFIAQELKNLEYEYAVVIAGDGTFNEVASQLVGSKTVVSIFPSGSGNGWAKNFSYTKNLKTWLLAFERLQTRLVDVGKIGEHYFFNVASVGFVAEVSASFQGLKKRGIRAYFFDLFRSIQNFRLYAMRLSINLLQSSRHKNFWQPKNHPSPPDSLFFNQFQNALVEKKQQEKQTEEVFTNYPTEEVVFSNLDFFLGRTFGGFLRPFPRKNLEEGVLNVIISNPWGDFFSVPMAKQKKLSFLQKIKNFFWLLQGFFFIFSRYLFGWFPNNIFLLEEKVRQAEILPSFLSQPQKILIQVDGEPREILLAPGDSLRVKILPQAFKVLV